MSKVPLRALVNPQSGAILSGSIEDFSGDVDFDGAVEISVSPEDLPAILNGAPVSKALSRAVTTPKSGSNLPSPEAVKNMAAGKRAVVAGGDPMLKSTFPLCMIQNGVVHTQPVAQQVSGRFFQDALLKSLIYVPSKTISLSTSGAGIGSTATITFNGNDLSPAGAQSFFTRPPVGGPTDAAVANYLATAAIIVITLTSSQLNAAPDQQITLSLTAKGEYGIDLSTDQFIISRSDGNKSTKIVLIPFTRAGDVVIPTLAFVGRLYDLVQNLVVSVKDADGTIGIRAEIPGRDSKELDGFLKTWGLASLRS